MILSRYARWLHTGWPAGTVEKLPAAGEGGVTGLDGARIVGDLTGIPLLKFSADSGARAVQAIVAEPGFVERRGGRDSEVFDLVILGGGVAGMAAALEARKSGLRFLVLEAAQPFNTIHNFPKAKPIYTYPTEMVPAGVLQVSAKVKERLVTELEGQSKDIEITRAFVERIERKGGELLVHTAGGDKRVFRALRVIIAIGRSGNYRQLGVAGEKLDKVYQRLFDAHDHAGKKVLVVGGGDSALETAIALAEAGAKVTLSYRNKEFARPKPENVEQLQAAEKQGRVLKLMGSQVKEIREAEVVLEDSAGRSVRLGNDVVFVMIGREPPLDFFRRSAIAIRGEWHARTYAAFVSFFLLCAFVYNWKAGTSLNQLFQDRHWFPFNLPSLGSEAQSAAWLGRFGQSALGKATLVSLRQPGFYYSLVYTVCILLFGWQRIRTRRTPYVKWQTAALASVQVLPLFVLPYFILPVLGYWGLFDTGLGKTIADNLFPKCGYDYGREYWRAFGLVLAWPLFFWNVFTSKPMAAWLAISFIQTFVLIPLIVYRWGKGAYCGWICSCGALAETVGDRHRHKMPHGPLWNRLNMTGQVILLVAMLLFVARVIGWYAPGTWVGKHAVGFYNTLFYSHSIFDYYHVVDIFLAGVVGVGMYFWLSGRVWCRFACPLAALMHIYARFSQFRIFADKKKCISCNVCTSVCHQGIDVMNFANKGLAMEDPECVRCSACVQSCPTGTLSFGRVAKGGEPRYDRLEASPVLMAEGKLRLRVIAG